MEAFLFIFHTIIADKIGVRTILFIFILFFNFSLWAESETELQAWKKRLAEIDIEVEKVESAFNQKSDELSKLNSQREKLFERINVAKKKVSDELKFLQENENNLVFPKQQRVEKVKALVKFENDEIRKKFEVDGVLLSVFMNAQVEGKLNEIIGREIENTADAQKQVKDLKQFKKDHYNEIMKRKGAQKQLRHLLDLLFARIPSLEKNIEDAKPLERENFYFENNELFNNSLSSKKEELRKLEEEKEIINNDPVHKKKTEEFEKIAYLKDELYSEMFQLDKKIKDYENRQKGIKENPHGDLAQCAGKKVKKIDLSKQFPPTKDQGKYGTCYSYAGVGVIEAALYRNSLNADGKHKYETHSYDPQVAAVCTAAYGPTAACDKRLSELLDEKTSAAYCAADLVSGGKPYNVIETFLKQADKESQTFLIPHGDVSFGEVDKLNEQALCDVRDLLKENGDTTALDELGKELRKTYRSSLDDWGKSFGASSVTETNGYWMQRKYGQKLHNGHLQGVREEIQKYGDVLTEKRGDDEPDCHLKEGSMFKKMVEKVMNSLCHGKPVSISVMTSGLEFKKDRKIDGKWIDGGWRPRMFMKGDKHGYHAMVVQGVDYDEKGDPVFIMRNSWKDGDKDNTNASLGRIKFREMCKAYDFTGLNGANEPGRDGDIPKALGSIEYVE